MQTFDEPQAPSGHDQGREEGSTFASLQTVGKLWPAVGRDLGEGRLRGAGCFSTGQQPRSKLLKLAGFRIALIRSILPGFAAALFPHELVETQTRGFSHSGATGFLRNPRFLSPRPCLFASGRHLFRNPHKWPVQHLQGFLPFLHCVHTSTECREESKWGLYTSQPEFCFFCSAPYPARPCC